MGTSSTTTICVAASFTLTLTLAAAITAYVWGNKRRNLEKKIKELEKSLKSSLEKCAAERQGRIKTQQVLRNALSQQNPDKSGLSSYPMIPIGTVQSCFSTRNGTPRQPLLVPLARACLVFDPVRVPEASLEGLEEYSHVWIIYVFHLNTDLEKLWLEPSRSKIKAKVRVPRLKGGKKGVFATRSPHRPSPIGLTVAKIEAVQGQMMLLSGVDLVDGTPVLDIKPYLPYCDSIQKSVVPEWVKEDGLLTVASVSFSESFQSDLANCWELVEKTTLYSSPSEIKRLIEQVLSWDIRSSSQRNRPHESPVTLGNSEPSESSLNTGDCDDEEPADLVNKEGSSSLIVYHLLLEGLDISYKIDSEGEVLVDSVMPACGVPKRNNVRCNYSIWKNKLK